jgi:hypothetical protein
MEAGMAKRVWLLVDARDVVMPEGYVVTVERGAALETTAEHAASLLEQVDVWSASAPGRGKAMAGEPKPDDAG